MQQGQKLTKGTGTRNVMSWIQADVALCIRACVLTTLAPTNLPLMKLK